ncbi:MAG TPA: hypothetical protein V6D20_19710 [Candidatus Obscuribacterales bacterium]
MNAHFVIVTGQTQHKIALTIHVNETLLSLLLARTGQFPVIEIEISQLLHKQKEPFIAIVISIVSETGIETGSTFIPQPAVLKLVGLLLDLTFVKVGHETNPAPLLREIVLWLLVLLLVVSPGPFSGLVVIP